MGGRLPLEPAFQSACPDCPAARQDVFAELVGVAKGDCAFHCPAVEPRSPVPERWFETYGLGLVRRGVLIRQRVDPQGRASAIDAAGPGCVFPLRDWRGPSSASGYAATRLLVCLLPQDRLETSLTDRQDSALDLVRLQSEAMERLERITEARGRSSAESRVAALMCALADTLSPPRNRDRITGLQQRDIAALLSMRHETVCRVLGNLEAKGAVTRSSDGLRIADRSVLEAV